MTKLERARAIATAEGLPEWQNDYMGTVLDQLLTVGLNFYETNVKEVLGDGVPLITMTPEQANEQARAFGKILLVFALDIAHIRETMQKENGEEKRDIPPTPPIESKEEGKEKATTTTTRARARERGDIFPPTEEMVLTECKDRKIEKMFGKFFMHEMKNEDWRHPKTGRKMRGWRKALVVWWSLEGSLKGNTRYEQFKEQFKEKPKPKAYTRDDWQYCDTCKCANFDTKRYCCTKYKAPPQSDERGNHSPYYCSDYEHKEESK